MIERAFTAAILTSYAFGVAASDGAEALAAELRSRYPATQVSSVRATPIPGVFEVVMGRNIAYVGQDARHFLFGHLYDMSAQRDLTAARKSDLERIDFSALPVRDAIRTVKGNGSRVLAVFADPNCGYCRQVEAELSKLDDVTIYTYLVPLLSPDSATKAVAVWCSANRGTAWGQLMQQGKTPAAASCETPLERNLALAQRLGIQATPTLVSADGRVLAGAATTPELDAWLSPRKSAMAVPVRSTH